MPILPPPGWLNKQFMEMVVQNIERNSRISSPNYEVGDVSESENNLGLLYRIKIDYNKQTANGIVVHGCSYIFIVKAPPDTEEILDFMNQIGAIQTEIHVYKTVLPAMYELLQDAMKSEIAYVDRITPYFYECPQEDVLVLEDLTQQGYKIKERCRLLDFAHSSFALKSLARFHAMSIALYLKNPNIFCSLQEKQFTEDPERLAAEKEFTATRIKQLISQLEKHPRHEQYLGKLAGVIENIVENVVQVVKPIKDSISVLTHGDFWIKNILFHYNSLNGNIDSVKFIDFQFCRFASPVLDLHYFLYTSVRPEVLLDQTSDLLEVYYLEFERMKRTLNCDRIQYTMEQLKEDFYEKEYFGFFNACTKLHVVLEGPSNHGETTGSAKASESDCGSVVLLEDVFSKLLPYFENKGFFEIFYLPENCNM